MRNEVINRTNEYGRQFVNRCLKRDEILGIEVSKSARNRNEFDVIYRDPDNKVLVAVLPEKDNTCNSSCFFGDLKYFAMVYALDFAEIPIMWPPACTGRVYPVWPSWYCKDAKKLEAFKREYNRLLQYEN